MEETLEPVEPPVPIDGSAKQPEAEDEQELEEVIKDETPEPKPPESNSTTLPGSLEIIEGHFCCCHLDQRPGTQL